MSEIIFNEDLHQYTHGGQPVISVTQLLEAVGYSDFSMVPAARLEPAQEFGTNTHDATYLDDMGELDEDSLSDPLRPYLAAWRRFKTDYKIKFIDREKIVHSDIFNFAGKLDCVFKTTPRKLTKIILADIKTSKMLYPSVRIQTALYEIAWEEQTGDLIDYRWAIQLRENGMYSVEPYKNKTDRVYALAALKVYKFRKENGLL